MKAIEAAARALHNAIDAELEKIEAAFDIEIQTLESRNRERIGGGGRPEPPHKAAIAGMVEEMEKSTGETLSALLPDPYQPDWSKAPEGALAWAVDEHQKAWFYSEKPAITTLHPRHWTGHGVCPDRRYQHGTVPDWKSSLRIKPGYCAHPDGSIKPIGEQVESFKNLLTIPLAQADYAEIKAAAEKAGIKHLHIEYSRTLGEFGWTVKSIVADGRTINNPTRSLLMGWQLMAADRKRKAMANEELQDKLLSALRMAHEALARTTLAQGCDAAYLAVAEALELADAEGLS